MEKPKTPKTFEEMSGNSELCDYCPIPKESQGIHCYNDTISMCEGRFCNEAYQNYLEEFEEEN